MDKYKARFSFLNHITKRWFWGKRVYSAYKADEVAELVKRVLKYIVVNDDSTLVDDNEYDWYAEHKRLRAELEQIVKEGEDGSR